jgi:predicted patatin/cPLA2 family phospholipase
MDLDWLWNTTIREIRLDLQRIYAKRKPFIVVLTDVQTGEALYKLTSAQNLEHVLKASSAMPLFYRSYPIVDDHPMTDGGVADAIPIGKAIGLGARRIMVIRSRHRDYLKCSDAFDFLMRWRMRRYPLLQKAMTERVCRYNESVKMIRKPPEGITIVEICPPENFRVSRLSQNHRILEEGYNQGRALADYAIARWEEA